MQGNSGVITVQPSETVYVQNRNPEDHCLILSVVLSIVCCLFCSWCVLWCTVPAIYYAIEVSRYQKVPGSIPSWIPDFSIFLCF